MIEPDKFVALDVETTGLDESADEIIEIGAVRFAEGKPVDKFSQLLSADKEIPEEVVRLTGIRKSDLRGKPEISDITQIFKNFIQGLPIVGHNISFDIGFLNKDINIKNPLIDTFEISRILLPYAKSYSLVNIAEYLGINVEVAHRAYDDAMNSGLIFLKLLEIIENTHPDILQTISGILGTKHPLFSIFQEGIEASFKKGTTRKNYSFPSPINVRIPERKDDIAIGKEIKAYFENELLQKREVQIKMAEAVKTAFEKERFLTVEAGTGAGKSLGYLIPSIAVSYKENMPIYISTYTKNLQNQIFYKDIPLAEKITGISVKTVILKGKNNYLCPEKMKVVLKERNKNFTKEERDAIAAIFFWSSITRTGDITEANFFLEPGIWELFKVDETCKNKECPIYNRCYYNKVKKEAETANVILVNHHLFFSGEIKGEIAVFDEAHELENAITNSISIKAGFSSIRFLLTEIKWYLKRNKKKTKDIDDVLLYSDRIFKLYGEQFLEKNPYGRGFFNGLSPHNIVDILNNVEEIYKNIKKTEELKKICEILETKVNEFKFVLNQEDKKFCYFAEVYKRKPEAIKFIAAPIDVSDYFVEKAENIFKSAVFTSATIKMGNSFDFFLKTLGLTKFEEKVDILDLGDIFPFKKQVLGIIPSDFPSPSSKGNVFINAVSEFINEVILPLGKGTLILFTSHQYLHDAYDEVSDTAKKMGIPCYAQNITGSKDAIIRSFKDELPALLLGTGSFWQGIDVPGKALEVLVITKIPFPNMSDPIIVSRIKHLREKGIDPFYNYQVPLAAVKYRQGFGRLIRKFSDRGIFIILDTRILLKEYGKIFIESIPVPLHIVKSQSQIIDMIQEWLPEQKK